MQEIGSANQGIGKSLGCIRYRGSKRKVVQFNIPDDLTAVTEIFQIVPLKFSLMIGSTIADNVLNKLAEQTLCFKQKQSIRFGTGSIGLCYRSKADKREYYRCEQAPYTDRHELGSIPKYCNSRAAITYWFFHSGFLQHIRQSLPANFQTLVRQKIVFH
jgi:hypothetical protein